MKGKTGTNTGSTEFSPAKMKRIKAKKKAEEKYWISRNGPVQVRQADPVKKPPSEV